MRLLEHERNKYRFFASMSNEIQFEYTANPSMVTISDWGAAQLKLPEIILEPEQDEAVRDVLAWKIWKGSLLHCGRQRRNNRLFNMIAAWL